MHSSEEIVANRYRDNRSKCYNIPDTKKEMFDLFWPGTGQFLFYRFLIG